ncbi:MAG: hypothetical protein MMC33_006087 [Icmadophila ericetorum]|nr:hypothetical protein [Icmadophila ericetorum]
MDELQSFLQSCLMKDYFVTDANGKWDFLDLKIRHEPHTLHFSTRRHLWRDLARYLQTPVTASRFPALASFAILGLDARQIRQRLVCYSPEFEVSPHFPNSMLKRLTLDGKWQELAQKVAYDLEVVDEVFGNKWTKNTATNGKENLQRIMRSAVEEVRDTWFTSLVSPEEKLYYTMGLIPEELYQVSVQRRALERRKEEQELLEETRGLR